MDLSSAVKLNITQNSYKESTHRLKCGREEHLIVLSSSQIPWLVSFFLWGTGGNTLSQYITGVHLPRTQAMRKEREARKMKKEEIISLQCSRFSFKWLAFQMLPNYSNWQMAATADGWAQLRHRYSCK